MLFRSRFLARVLFRRLIPAAAQENPENGKGKPRLERTNRGSRESCVGLVVLRPGTRAGLPLF